MSLDWLESHDRPADWVMPDDDAPRRAGAPRSEDPRATPPRRQRRRASVWAFVWVLAVIGGMGLVMYGFGPLFEARDQRRLVTQYARQVDRAANESTGLGGVSTPTKAPDLGTPVAILEIGAIHLQQVVVEGGYPSQTRRGPGHITGTAGVGQPGNSVVVGRAHAFGGPFGSLGAVRKGDTVLVTTTQGQSVYRVTTVGPRNLSNVDSVYAPTKDNRLTLVTSASIAPWNNTDGSVVVAVLQGQPFPPTLQNGRVSTGSGVDGEQDADATLILTLLLFGITISASIFLYRRVRPATAYLLTIGPLMATAIIAGETFSRVFPGWT
jgi:sortase A